MPGVVRLGIFRRKLKWPDAGDCLSRPRLLERLSAAPVALLQAPAGAGKTALLGDWLGKAGPAVYYALDELDRDEGTFAAHLAFGFGGVWPDWAPLPMALTDARQLATEVVAAAEEHAPVCLVLDSLEAAFGCRHLAEFLELLLRYAPPELKVVLSSRAPLPAGLDRFAQPGALIAAADLAFTADEANQLLGEGEWQDCHRLTGGYPLALTLWRDRRPSWLSVLRAHAISQGPPHLAADVNRGLVTQWLSGQMPLSQYGQLASTGRMAAEQLWSEVHEIRWLIAKHPPAARERLEPLWTRAHNEGDRKLLGAVALLQGEVSTLLGHYGDAMDWYQTAFDADPDLELHGAHSMAVVRKDLGFLDEAEALARKYVEVRRETGDLLGLGFAHMHYGMICLERGRFDEAEEHLQAAEHIGFELNANAVVGTVALMNRALVEATRQNLTGFRKLAEEAHGLARGRWPWVEAAAAHILASAMLAWGETASAEQLLKESYDYCRAADARHHLHVLLTVFARTNWAMDRRDLARSQFDEVLRLAATEGYMHYLQSPRSRALPLICDALARGVETGLCQDLLVRMGDRAVDALLTMTADGDPVVRRAAVYPLATLGGEQSVRVIQRLLDDGDVGVRDAALLACHALLQSVPVVSNEAAAAAAVPVDSGAGGLAAPAGKHAVQVLLLGPLTVRAAGKELDHWRTAKSRDMLAYLALNRGRPVTRDQLIEALWPEADPAAILGSFHTSMHHLRRGLGDQAASLITFGGGAYRFDASRAYLDLDDFTEAAAAAAEQDWRRAVALYRGNLLEDLSYDWCEAPREKARQVYTGVLRRLAAYLGRGSRVEEALDALQLLIQADPLSEDAHVELMECYVALGNRSAAIQQYRTLVRLLDEELGLSPGPKAQAAYARILD